MIRNNDNLQMNDFINNKSVGYLKKGKKKSQRTKKAQKVNNNIPNLNFYFMNGRAHIADNTHLNIPSLNEIQSVGRDIQNNINNRLNQILQNPVRNNEQVLNELRNIRGVQNDITNRILPNIGQALERGNALNEAGLVINSSNPVGRNPVNGPDLRRSQQEQVIPVIENLQQYGPVNPYLNQLLNRARELPNQYESPEPENIPPSQPPPPSEAGMNFRTPENVGGIDKSSKPARGDDDSEDDDSDDDQQNIEFSNRTPQINRGSSNLNFFTPQSARPLLISSAPTINRVSMGGFGGSAVQIGEDRVGPDTGRRSLDVEISNEQDQILSPRGIYEDRN